MTSPVFETLAVIDDPQPHGAAFNMAMDEALLETLADTPLLRFYRWERPAVSFGYFDQAGPVLTAYPQREPVRRWTGGGIVEHGNDFTYSLLVPRSHALTAARAEESYRVLHTLVAQAMAAAGAAPPVMQDRSQAPGAGEPTRPCFVNAVRYDLLLDHRKVAGAAQRRTRRGWLQQGSIQLPGDASSVYACLRQTLPAAFAAEPHAVAIKPEVMPAARSLARQKYGTEVWLRRR